MVIGLLPMMFAHGVGANGNRALGAGSVGGMLIGMICQIFVVPALFCVFQLIQEKFRPIQWQNEEKKAAQSKAKSNNTLNNLSLARFFLPDLSQ